MRRRRRRQFCFFNGLKSVLKSGKSGARINASESEDAFQLDRIIKTFVLVS